MDVILFDCSCDLAKCGGEIQQIVMIISNSYLVLNNFIYAE